MNPIKFKDFRPRKRLGVASDDFIGKRLISELQLELLLIVSLLLDDVELKILKAIEMLVILAATCLFQGATNTI